MADTTLERLERLNEIGVALSNEPNIERLLEKIVNAAMAITYADGGTLYLMRDDGQALRFCIVRTESLKFAYSGDSVQALNFPDIPLYTDNGEPNNAMIAAYAVINRQTVNIPDAYAAEGFDFSGTRHFDQQAGYHSQSFLTIPLQDHQRKIIGVLQLINALNPVTGSICAFGHADQRLVESLASQAAIKLTNRRLQLQFEHLFESFIHLINTAIDEKSPYTGAHCQRVPALAMMLAKAANTANNGVLADFHLDEAMWQELNIAALLHDCGKITTPVHIVDKATKLQTLFDRINLINARFEILERDLEIATLTERLNGVPVDTAERQRNEKLARMQADQNFLYQANSGGENMSEADQARVAAIATRYTFTENGRKRDLLDENEIENLSIASGTLTRAEREIINHHIVSTIQMLEALPWPDHLKKVPEYAGGHHERMDGKGYPKGLTRAQLPIPARIIGIADIFEALTAEDRPYKPGMKLSQALSILKRFRDDGHIDPDLYDVFIQTKVYLDYAQHFLRSEQIDVS